jgi:HlyD family secretion protein
MSPRNKRFGYLFTLAVPVVVLGALIAWVLAYPVSGTGAFVYDTVPVSKGPIRKIVSTSGPVRALVTVSVGSQLSGQIETVHVDFNSAVKPGDLLARIDGKTFAARVAQGKADLAAADAALANQEAARAKSLAVLKLAERTVERQKALAAKGFAATAVLDQATRDLEVGRADITVADAQIASAQAAIAQRKAQLHQAEIDLDRTEIRAPIEGTVISRSVDPGQTVAASLQAPELFKIAQDLSRIRIEAQVNEADVGAVAEGNSVIFSVDAYPDRRFEGRVSQVRLAATEIANVVTYTVIIEAANADRRLFPGMTANCEIEVARKEDTLRISNDAFRFKPKAETASASAGSAGAESERTERTIGRLKTELGLDAGQEAALREALARLREERQADGQGRIGTPPSDPSVLRQRLNAEIEKALGPRLSSDQRRAFESWKQGRETVRYASLWVLGQEGVPVRRGVRVGISDGQYTELIGSELAEGEAVIVRAREALQ